MAWYVKSTTKSITELACLLVVYSSGQNKVPITYRLVNDSTTSQRLVSDFTAKSFRKVASIIVQPENFQLKLCFTFAYAYATIRIGITLELLRRPISQLNSFPLDFYFFFYFLVAGISSTEQLKLYNPLKNSLA